MGNRGNSGLGTMAIIEKYNEKGIKIYHGDCMEAMAVMPDKAFELAIVDPPYGIGEDGKSNHSRGHKNLPATKFTIKAWDNKPCGRDYFTKLQRISKNQV